MDKTCATCRAFFRAYEEAQEWCRLHPVPTTTSAAYWCLQWQPKEKETIRKVEAQRGTIYPPDFTPDERACLVAKSQGQNVHALAAAFKDHHTAKGTVFKDWQAAFRNWLRNDLAFKKGKL